MGGKDGGVSCLEIPGKTLYSRMLVKVCGCQIKLIGLIEMMGKCYEGDRIKAIL